MQASETTVEPSAVPQPAAFAPEAVPIGVPLEWPIVDDDGSLLLDRGTVVIGAEERRFLFEQFKPQRGDLRPSGCPPARAPNAPANDESNSPTLRDMHLTIGALIGMRPHVGSGAPMHPCRIIGFAPNEALFVTPPIVDGRMLPLTAGENVEIVAIASQAVFRFVCTVDAICHLPFEYVVLSKPGVIRRLRERKSIRVHARLPVRYSVDVDSNVYEGVGVAQSFSTLGMSFGTPWTLGSVGQRLRVAFRLQSNECDTCIETTAVIRNIQSNPRRNALTIHGLEFEQLEQVQQMALKSFVFDRLDDVIYWSNGSKS
jgi:c-di-GMP-binding flagellar brake protein YcgR